MAERTRRWWSILDAVMARMDVTSGAHHYNNTWMLLRIQLALAMMSSQWPMQKMLKPKKNLALYGATSV
jgi:hypothetical protein